MLLKPMHPLTLEALCAPYLKLKIKLWSMTASCRRIGLSWTAKSSSSHLVVRTQRPFKHKIHNSSSNSLMWSSEWLKPEAITPTFSNNISNNNSNFQPSATSPVSDARKRHFRTMPISPLVNVSSKLYNANNYNNNSNSSPIARTNHTNFLLIKLHMTPNMTYF